MNYVAYSWAMIQLTATNLTGSSQENTMVLSGVTAIKWNRKQHIETNYGIGGKPINRGFGNWESSASITMDYTTQVQLRAALPSLMSRGDFDLVVSFANPIDASDWGTETVTLKGCFFNEDGFEATQDDTNLTKEFELNPFDIIIQDTTAGN